MIEDPKGEAQSWEYELGMSRSEQETARKILKKRGLIIEELKGNPAKLYYMVDIKVLEDFLCNNYPPVRIPPTSRRKVTNKTAKNNQQDGGIPSTSRGNSPQQEGGIPPSC